MLKSKIIWKCMVVYDICSAKLMGYVSATFQIWCFGHHQFLSSFSQESGWTIFTKAGWAGEKKGTQQDNVRLQPAVAAANNKLFWAQEKQAEKDSVGYLS